MISTSRRLPQLDEAVRDELMEALPNPVIASAIGQLDTDDAAYLIEDMDEADQREILAGVPAEERVALTRALDYPEYSAGRLMQTEFVAVPAFWTVRQTLDHLRRDHDLPEDLPRNLRRGSGLSPDWRGAAQPLAQGAGPRPHRRADG